MGSDGLAARAAIITDSLLQRLHGRMLLAALPRLSRRVGGSGGYG